MILVTCGVCGDQRLDPEACILYHDVTDTWLRWRCTACDSQWNRHVRGREYAVLVAAGVPLVRHPIFLPPLPASVLRDGVEAMRILRDHARIANAETVADLFGEEVG